MHIESVAITNFRLLSSVRIDLEHDATVVVGRNNTGKTSLVELFSKLLRDTRPFSFCLEDFSPCTHDRFVAAYRIASGGADEEAVRNALPAIEVTLRIRYPAGETQLGRLGDFIIDLDPQQTVAVITAQFRLADGGATGFFRDVVVDPGLPPDRFHTEVLRSLRDRVGSHFDARVIAVDPGDPANIKVLDFKAFRSVVFGGIVSAERGLDEVSNREARRLGEIVEQLFNSASSPGASSNDQLLAQQLRDATQGIQSTIDAGFTQLLQGLLPTFQLFNYPNLIDPGLQTETTLDVERLLRNHTRVSYAGASGLTLPESYSGLGIRNLLYILFRLYQFSKQFYAEGGAVVHLILIEEPEVHLHPQMQEVFIEQVRKLRTAFTAALGASAPWPIQLVVTTHSSHIANRAEFNAVRYFLAPPAADGTAYRHTRVKNLGTGLTGIESDDRRFLHQYMTLTRCDLLFADKAILIEGTSERLLIPRMIRKLDSHSAASARMSTQYLSLVEVGGAYAHLFFPLLRFLELPTLIVTDLDSIDSNDHRRKCPVAQGTHSSNACLGRWFNDSSITLSAIRAKTAEDLVSGCLRIAYQIPESEDSGCARSFEDAFMLANPSLFDLAGSPAADHAQLAWDRAQKIDKSEFAMTYVLRDDWEVPKYIADGIRWLADSSVVLPPATASSPASDVGAQGATVEAGS